MKSWKSTVFGLLVILAQAFVDSQRGARTESLAGYATGAGLIVAKDHEERQ